MGEPALRHRGDRGEIHSVADLDQAVRIIGLYDIKIENIKNELDVRIKQLRAQAVAQIAELSADRENLLAQAQLFTVNNSADVLKGKKTAALNFGKVGFRRNPEKIPLPAKGSSDMDALCAEIEKQALDLLVPVHVQKFVKAPEMKKLEDEQLAQIGLRRIAAADVFFCEPDREKLREVDNGL